MIKKLTYIGIDFGRQMARKNVSAFASNAAFFLFLSLIPALMLLCSLLPYTPLTEADLMEGVTKIAPGAMNPLLISIISDVYDKSIGIVSVTAIVTLWSAGKGMLALMRGLNAINDVEEDRNYILLRVVASFYTVLVLLLVVISLLLMVFGNVLISLVEGVIPQSQYLFDLLIHFRMLAVWIIITVTIALMYAYVPGDRTRFRTQLPGAALASAGWNVVTWGFSVYVDRFNGFTMYGNLTTIIILMLWLYTCMYIVMAGAYLNRYFKPAFQFFVRNFPDKRQAGKGKQ